MALPLAEASSASSEAPRAPEEGNSAALNVAAAGSSAGLSSSAQADPVSKRAATHRGRAGWGGIGGPRLRLSRPQESITRTNDSAGSSADRRGRSIIPILAASAPFSSPLLPQPEHVRLK